MTKPATKSVNVKPAHPAASKARAIAIPTEQVPLVAPAMDLAARQARVKQLREQAEAEERAIAGEVATKRAELDAKLIAAQAEVERIKAEYLAQGLTLAKGKGDGTKRERLTVEQLAAKGFDHPAFMVHFHGKTDREVAEAMGIKGKNANTRVNIVRNRRKAPSKSQLETLHKLGAQPNV